MSRGCTFERFDRRGRSETGELSQNFQGAHGSGCVGCPIEFREEGRRGGLGDNISDGTTGCASCVLVFFLPSNGAPGLGSRPFYNVVRVWFAQRKRRSSCFRVFWLGRLRGFWLEGCESAEPRRLKVLMCLDCCPAVSLGRRAPVGLYRFARERERDPSVGTLFTAPTLFA